MVQIMFCLTDMVNKQVGSLGAPCTANMANDWALLKAITLANTESC